MTTAHGTYAGDTMPMGTLSWSSGGQPFNLVRIAIAPNQPQGASDFLVDNVSVIVVATPTPTPTPVQNAAVNWWLYP